jgi:hypothetical protein
LIRTPASCPPARVRPKSPLPFHWPTSSASHAGNSWAGGWTSAGAQPCGYWRGDREWVEGYGPPAAALAADPFELFRALSGRRSLDQVRTLARDGDPKPYLDVLSPYQMPPSPQLE